MLNIQLGSWGAPVQGRAERDCGEQNPEMSTESRAACAGSHTALRNSIPSTPSNRYRLLSRPAKRIPLGEEPHGGCRQRKRLCPSAAEQLGLGEALRPALP